MEHAKTIDFLESKENNKLIDKVDFNQDKESYFKEIFYLYYKRIFNYTYYRVNSKTNAEDITSEVFEKVICKIDTFNKDKGKFEIWIFAIARNTINDHARRNKIRKLISLDGIFNMADDKKGPEDELIKKDTNYKLIKALDVLNDTERNIVAYKYGAKLKNTEIAKIMNMSESNVGVKLFRITKKLKKELVKEEITL